MYFGVSVPCKCKAIGILVFHWAQGQCAKIFVTVPELNMRCLYVLIAPLISSVTSSFFFFLSLPSNLFLTGPLPNSLQPSLSFPRRYWTSKWKPKQFNIWDQDPVSRYTPGEQGGDQHGGGESTGSSRVTSQFAIVIKNLWFHWASIIIIGITRDHGIGITNPVEFRQFTFNHGIDSFRKQISLGTTSSRIYHSDQHQRSNIHSCSYGFTSFKDAVLR